jgi:hypothetical protein
VKLTCDQLLPFVAAKSTLRVAATALGCCPQTVLNSLRRHGLSIPPNVRQPRATPRCSRCGETDESKFDKRTKTSKCWWSWCTTCRQAIVREQGRNVKRRIVEILGKKCCLCGFSDYISALDVHHANPAKKEFSVASLRRRKWPTVLKEIEKCVLLCANCHRAHHHDELAPDLKQKLLQLTAGKI